MEHKGTISVAYSTGEGVGDVPIPDEVDPPEEVYELSFLEEGVTIEEGSPAGFVGIQAVNGSEIIEVHNTGDLAITLFSHSIGGLPAGLNVSMDTDVSDIPVLQPDDTAELLYSWIPSNTQPPGTYEGEMTVVDEVGNEFTFDVEFELSS